MHAVAVHVDWGGGGVSTQLEVLEDVRINGWF